MEFQGIKGILQNKEGGKYEVKYCLSERENVEKH